MSVFGIMPMLLLSTILLASCVEEPRLRDEPFGESVRHMILVQTTDPEREPLGLDGEKALSALQAYRSGSGGDGQGGGDGGQGSGSPADALSSGIGELSGSIASGLGLGGGN